MKATAITNARLNTSKPRDIGFDVVDARIEGNGVNRRKDAEGVECCTAASFVGGGGSIVPDNHDLIHEPETPSSFGFRDRPYRKCIR